MCGAAILVPERLTCILSRQFETPEKANILDLAAQISTPGPEISGLCRSRPCQMTGPRELNVAIFFCLLTAATVIAFLAVPGEPTVPAPSSPLLPAETTATTPASTA